MILFYFLYLYYQFFCFYCFEIRIIYINFENNNNSNRSQYNFEIDENGKTNLLRFSSNISITKPIQWNHTSFYKSIFRLIFIFILFLCSCIFYFIIKWDDNNIFL